MLVNYSQHNTKDQSSGSKGKKKEKKVLMLVLYHNDSYQHQFCGEKSCQGFAFREVNSFALCSSSLATKLKRIDTMDTKASGAE